uniref:Sm domain-containing protein n=1 Tax=Saimiri boliviensis boliviensis TaxID=39432 RepID=A0A2K6SSD6_SAIBB
MAVSHSVKEQTVSENSLIILLQGLQGQVTTVGLRDESMASECIVNVDAFMNICLAKVTYRDHWWHQDKLDDLFMIGRNQQLQIFHCMRNFGGKGQGWWEFPSKNYKRGPQ